MELLAKNQSLFFNESVIVLLCICEITCDFKKSYYIEAKMFSFFFLDSALYMFSRIGLSVKY